VESLTIGEAPTQLLEEGSQCVQFRAKATPVTGFQLLDSAVVVAERLARSIGLGSGERGFGRRLFASTSPFCKYRYILWGISFDDK
jgi:hypothetical protein